MFTSRYCNPTLCFQQINGLDRVGCAGPMFRGTCDFFLTSLESLERAVLGLVKRV